MSAPQPETGTFGRRDFFSRLFKGARSKARVAAVPAAEDDMRVASHELKVHAKADLQAFLERLAAKNGGSR